MSDPITDTDLTRYVAGRCTAADEARIRLWVAEDAERQARVDELRRVWELGELPLEQWDTRAAWTELAGRRDERRYSIPDRRAARAPVPVRGGFRGWQAPRWSWPARIAAGLLLAAGVATLWRVAPAPREAVAPGQANEYVTRPGQRAELRLVDGTRVLLSVDSRLLVPADFGRRGRNVSLEGEALFDVRHDPDRPFRVTTGRGVAEDLGTEFVVTAYPEDRDLHVAVVSGVVAFHPASGVGAAPADSQVVRLTRGDVVHLDSTGTSRVQRGIDLTPWTAWAGGTLVFEGTPLAEALPRLERWYDTDIRLSDPALGARRLTAMFDNEPLAGVLDLLALSFDLTVERQGRTVVLAPKRPLTR